MAHTTKSRICRGSIDWAKGEDDESDLEDPKPRHGEAWVPKFTDEQWSWLVQKFLLGGVHGSDRNAAKNSDLTRHQILQGRSALAELLTQHCSRNLRELIAAISAGKEFRGLDASCAVQLRAWDDTSMNQSYVQYLGAPVEQSLTQTMQVRKGFTFYLQARV